MFCIVTYKISDMKCIKDIILKKSVRAKLLFVVGAGLPHSGTTSLIEGIVNPITINGQEVSPNKLKIYPTAFFKDTVEDDGHLIHFGKEDEDDGMLLLALAKLLVTKQFVWSAVELESSDELFSKDARVNQYFNTFCKRLFDFLKEVQVPKGPVSGEKDLSLVALTKSQSFINFLDITVNKAIYECLFIVGSWCKNGFLLCVLDLFHYTCEALNEKLDLKDAYFEGKYREEDAKLLKIQSACHFLMSIFEGTFEATEDATGGTHKVTENTFEDTKRSEDTSSNSRAILVCTRRDKCENDMSRRKDNLVRMLCEVIKKMKKCPLDVSDVLCISNLDKKCYSEVRKKLIRTIEKSLGHNNFVHLKNLFLYSILKKLDKIVLSKELVAKYGGMCNIDSTDIDFCLKQLHDGCFLFYIGDFVIMKLADFITDIEKLYYCKNDVDSSKIESGFVSTDLCEKLWGSSSTSHYISILTRVGLMVDIKRNGFSTHFMPSLRAEYSEPSMNSGSMFIISSISSIPFHTQCIFAKCFLAVFKGAEVEECPYYNVLKMKLSSQTTMSVTFDSKYLKVTTVSEDPNDTVSGDELSAIKNACADALNKIRCEVVKDLRYQFGVVCPSGESEVHFFFFDGSCNASSEDQKCTYCNQTIKTEALAEKSAWAFCACESYEFHKEGKKFDQ